MNANTLGPKLYLNMLHGAEPEGFRELRAFRGGKVFQEWYPVGDPPDKLLADAGQLDGYDVFVGVAPRAERKGGKDAIRRSHVLWADLDDAEAVARAEGFEPAPSMRVGSGNGEHAYWAVWPPVPGEQVRRANLRLQRALGSDKNACDSARVLRLPGTVNHKRGERARILDATPAVFDAEEVVGSLPDDVVHLKHSAAQHRRGDPLRAVPPAVYVAELTGRTPDRSRKIRCPFHEDWLPSLHVFEDGWFCFQCEDDEQGVGERRGGDIFNLAAYVWGLDCKRDFREIRKRLLERFV